MVLVVLTNCRDLKNPWFHQFLAVQPCHLLLIISVSALAPQSQAVFSICTSLCRCSKCLQKFLVLCDFHTLPPLDILVLQVKQSAFELSPPQH